MNKMSKYHYELLSIYNAKLLAAASIFVSLKIME